MPTASQTTPQKRAYRGRSVTGCKTCRQKHVKCDESRPSCMRCLKLNLKCSWKKGSRGLAHHGMNEDYEIPLIILKARPSAFGDRPYLESENFDRLKHYLGPGLSMYEDHRFWNDVVIPAAETHRRVFSAALALGTLFDLSLSEVGHGRSFRHQQSKQGIQWYNDSLSTSMRTELDIQSVSEIVIWLLTTILYIHVEIRLSNTKSQSTLARIAFSIIHSVRDLLSESKNPLILACLCLLLDMQFQFALESAQIPKAHRDFITILALKLCADLQVDQAFQMRFELYKISFDVQDAIQNNDKNEEVDFQLREFGKRLRELQAMQGPFDFRNVKTHDTIRMHCKYSTVLMLWETHTNGSQDVIDLIVSDLLAMFEISEAVQLAQGPRWWLDMATVPKCIMLAWHSRTASVHQRIIKLLYSNTTYDESSLFVQRSAAYIKTLITTDPDKATQLEIEVLGGRPRVLQRWQANQIVHRLIRGIKDDCDSRYVPFDHSGISKQVDLHS